MRRALCAAAAAALLLAGTLTPSLANPAAHPGTMCVRGVQGACNPGLPGWGNDRNGDRSWHCHPVMPRAARGHARSHAWVCGWVPVPSRSR